MPYSLPLVPRGDSTPYSFFKDFLSPEECDRVIEIAKSLPLEIAYIGGGPAGSGVVDPKKRASDIRWLNWGPDYEWLFSRLAINIAVSNSKWFGFKLVGMNEALQMTHYKSAKPAAAVPVPKKSKRKSAPEPLIVEPQKALVDAIEAVDGHYDWHEDHAEGGNFSLRKLSFVIPLNDGYEGGEFRLFHHPVAEQAKGTMIVFPSYKTHCVSPVTKGERWSLVGWVTGPPFR
jgi:hypothetical protein